MWSCDQSLAALAFPCQCLKKLKGKNWLGGWGWGVGPLILNRVNYNLEISILDIDSEGLLLRCLHASSISFSVKILIFYCLFKKTSQDIKKRKSKYKINYEIVLPFIDHVSAGAS